MNPGRPEYPDYLDWLGVDQTAGKMDLLGRSGGRRETDQLCVYPEVEPNDQGEMILYFFSHGLRYLISAEQEAIGRLKPGDSLQLKRDDENARDRYALLLKTAESVRVGYCPRYLNQDLRSIRNQVPIRLTVEKVNPDAPLQFRLLCKAVFTPPEATVFIVKPHKLKRRTKESGF